VLVATTGLQVNWPEPVASEPRRLGEVLEDPRSQDWWDRTTKPWPFNHWEAQTAKGNGFAPPILTADTVRVPTIKKRYFAGQGDNPVVGHPERSGVCRWLTLNEVQRLHGIPETYDLSGPKTVAGEVVGQGVLVNLFRSIIETAAGQGCPGRERRQDATRHCGRASDSTPVRRNAQ
jgi:site-specific DNA-cytosine methylase